MSRVRADRYTNRAGTGSPTFSEGVNVVGISSLGITTVTGVGQTALTVNGDARITGVLTVGQGSVTIDGTSGNSSITGVTTVGITSAYITSINDLNYPTAGPLSNRNLVINGAMQVAQRGTVVNAGSEYAGPDRFRFTKNDGAFTVSQDTDVPSGQGFANSWKCDVTTVAGVEGNFYVFLKYRFEGQDLQRLKKGTSSAESLTLQFWIKSPKTGTHIAELYDTDNDRTISKSYTVNVADTWEFKTLTFPGDTTGTLDNDNNNSFEINLWLFAGTGFSSGTLNTSWNTNTDANRAVGQVNTADNTANNIYFTGVQLEVGSVATPFEHRSYGEELARCQRYYQILEIPGNAYGAQYATVGSGVFAGLPLTFITKMRTAPTSVNYEHISGSEYWVQVSTTAFSGEGGAGRTFAFTDSSVKIQQTRVSGNNTPSGSSYYVWEASFKLLLSSEL